MFCSIGRLTRQKNYLELIKGFTNFSKKNGERSNLIILGEGEDKQKLKKFIKEQNIKNCFLLGFKKIHIDIYQNQNFIYAHHYGKSLGIL